MNIEAEPYLSIVLRYAEAMPQYEVGHLQRVDVIEERTREVEGLTLVGNAYRGVGIPDTIAYAERTADRFADVA
jgi:oxygen-dependent protoporphyrinogen oxidase